MKCKVDSIRHRREDATLAPRWDPSAVCPAPAASPRGCCWLKLTSQFPGLSLRWALAEFTWPLVRVEENQTGWLWFDTNTRTFFVIKQCQSWMMTQSNFKWNLCQVQILENSFHLHPFSQSRLITNDCMWDWCAKSWSDKSMSRLCNYSHKWLFTWQVQCVSLMSTHFTHCSSFRFNWSD